MASLDDRVAAAATTLWKIHKRIDPLAIIAQLGWFHGALEKRWRERDVDCLETVLLLPPHKLPAVLVSLRRWCEREGG